MWTYVIVAMLTALLCIAARKIYKSKKKGSCYGCCGCSDDKGCVKNES